MRRPPGRRACIMNISESGIYVSLKKSSEVSMSASWAGSESELPRAALPQIPFRASILSDQSHICPALVTLVMLPKR